MNANEINQMIRRIQMADVKTQWANRIADIFLWLILTAILMLFFWTPDARADTQKEVIAESLLLMDWAQTRDIVRHQSSCEASHGLPLVDIARACQGGYYETNPIIGKSPSMGKVNTYFATVMLGHYLIDWQLSDVNQDRFEWATIALEAAVVLHNRHIGLSMKF
jgi:hypothetical protein